MSPARKHEAVSKLQSQLGMSERRTCRVLDQPRSCQRYQSQPRCDEPKLVQRMLQLVRRRPRFGYRRIAALLREEGFWASESRILRRLAAGGTESAGEEAQETPPGDHGQRLLLGLGGRRDKRELDCELDYRSDWKFMA